MIDDEFAIERQKDAAAGRYVIHLPDGAEAEMTFVMTGPNTMTIDHTGVPHAYRGAGLAARLVHRAIADARAAGTKIVPLCSYVEAQFRRHPEWSDLLAH